MGPASVVPTSSNGEMLVPALLSQQFAADQGALWQNLTSTGADKLAFTYYGTIDSFLFSTLPGWLAHAIRSSSVIVVAVLSAYAVGRNILQFSRSAALFVGAAYGVGIIGQLFAGSIGYFPIILLVIYGVLENRTSAARWAVLFAVLYAFADMTYFSQMVPWSMATIVFWFLFVTPRKTIIDWGIIIAVCLIMVALRADDFEALFANAPLSFMGLARTTPDLGQALYGSIRSLYLFGGPVQTACTALFLVSLVARRNDKLLWSVGAALLISIFLYPLGVAVQSFAAEILPFLKGYSMDYAGRIGTTILPFAAGFGIDVLVNNQTISRINVPRGIPLIVRRLGLTLCISAIAFVSLKTKYVSLYTWVTNGSFAHNFQSPVIEELADSIRTEKKPVRVETFQIIPNYMHAYGIEPAGGYQILHSRRYYEFWAKMVEPWAASLTPESRFYKQYADRRARMEGNLAFRDDRLWLFPDTYRPTWQLANIYRLNLLSLANVGYLLSRDRLTDSSLVPIRKMPRPWSAMKAREKALENIKANFYGRSYFNIYKNTTVIPRFFTVSGINVANGADNLLNDMSKASVSLLRQQAFVSKLDLPRGFDSTQTFSRRQVTVEQYEKDQIRLTLSSGGPALLIATNSYSPFWTVEIDGVESEIFPAYHTFWGVQIPAGAKSIVFRYRPPYKLS
ncbi:MAG: YfhO family protein [Rhodospirillales bacterium]|nr:YfhO family protein [Rhodospirillales bacterium]